jgi:hypothetical protein
MKKMDVMALGPGPIMSGTPAENKEDSKSPEWPEEEASPALEGACPARAQLHTPSNLRKTKTTRGVGDAS